MKASYTAKNRTADKIAFQLYNPTAPIFVIKERCGIWMDFPCQSNTCATLLVTAINNPEKSSIIV